MTNTPSANVQGPQPENPEARIARLIAELPGSGMTVAAFARKHGVPPWKLYNVLKV